jgi:ribosomal protein L11 methylase PrmA
LFAELTADYEKDLSELTEQNSKMQAELSAFAEDSENAERFIQLSRKYAEFDELTAQILNEFVDRVVIYPTDKSKPEHTRDIEIYLNCVGKFDVPQRPEPQLSETEQKFFSIGDDYGTGYAPNTLTVYYEQSVTVWVLFSSP